MAVLCQTHRLPLCTMKTACEGLHCDYVDNGELVQAEQTEADLRHTGGAD